MNNASASSASASNGAAYTELNRQWSQTARVIFGEDVGGLEGFGPWLREIREPVSERKTRGGKSVVVPLDDYAPSAGFVSLSEVEFGKKFEPLSINEVKDIDGILEAVKERLHYCGDIVLGNSSWVEKGADVSDSHGVFDAGVVSNSKNVAYSALVIRSENIFGCNLVGDSNYCVCCRNNRGNTRCFEVWRSTYSSDSMYCYNIENCQDCIFCFNQRSKKRSIGNLELEAGKYLGIKRKIAGEMREKLSKEKRLPFLSDIMAACTLEAGGTRAAASVGRKDKPFDKSKIEEAFSRTSEVVLGKRLEGVDDYAEWLKRHTIGISCTPSAFSKSPVLNGEYQHFARIPINRIVTEAEGEKLGELARLSSEEVESLSLSNAHELLGQIAYGATEFGFGTLENVSECPVAGFATHGYRTISHVDAKYSAYCTWPRFSDYTFGCRMLFFSAMCINSYHSARLRGCFEVDNSRDCSSAYFCHNAENVQDALFCFNVKNKRNAIGNTEFEKSKFLGIKQKVLGEVLQELGKTKSCKYDIYGLC